MAEGFLLFQGMLPIPVTGGSVHALPCPAAAPAPRLLPLRDPTGPAASGVPGPGGRGFAWRGPEPGLTRESRIEPHRAAS